MTLTREDLEARASVATEARDYLDASLTRHEALNPKDRPAQETRVPDAHKALRLIYHDTPVDEPFPEDAFVELADLIWQALEEISSARRAALEAGPVVKDPAAEFERLLGKAEEAAAASGGHDRARALAEIAGRWLTPELTSARKRSPQPESMKVLSPVETALLTFSGLNLPEADVALYITGAAKLAASATPMEALIVLAASAARGHFTEDDMLELRALINRPARPANPEEAE